MAQAVGIDVGVNVEVALVGVEVLVGCGVTVGPTGVWVGREVLVAVRDGVLVKVGVCVGCVGVVM